MNEYERVLYKRALDEWGVKTQAEMTQGECGELIAALCRYFTQDKGNVVEVIGELADVEIMLEQMSLIFPRTAIDAVKRKKLERLDKILSGEIEHPHKKS